MLCIFASFGAIIGSTIYADSITVTNITTKVRDGVDSYLTIGADNMYHARFNAEATNPYKTHTVELSLFLSTGQKFDEIGGADKNAIIERTIWSVNGTSIVWNNFTFENSSFKLTLSGKDLEITPCKAGAYTITCSIDNATVTTTLMCDYAEPTTLNLKVEGQKEQLYETFTDITLTAVINNTEYLDPNKEYTYLWYINTTDQKNLITNQTSNTLIITKNMIKIEKMKFIVVLAQNTTLQKSTDITITTEQQYTVTLNQTQPLELEITDTAVNLKATVPSSTYEVIWFLCYPNNFLFEMQTTTESGFTFNPSNYSPGKYKVFAKAIITEDANKKVESISDVLVITILKPEVDIDKDVELEITPRAYANKDTGVQGFELSVDLQGAYPEDRIVWLIDGAAYGRGSQINFDPILAGEYYIQIRLLDNNGRVINAGGPLADLTFEAEPVQTDSLWIFIGCAVGAIIILCVLSIIISNKKREKIW